MQILTGPFQLEIFCGFKSATDGVADNVQVWDGDKMTTVTCFLGLQLEDLLQHAGSVGTLCVQGPRERRRKGSRRALAFLGKLT